MIYKTDCISKYHTQVVKSITQKQSEEKITNGIHKA